MPSALKTRAPPPVRGREADRCKPDAEFGTSVADSRDSRFAPGVGEGFLWNLPPSCDGHAPFGLEWVRGLHPLSAGLVFVLTSRMVAFWQILLKRSGLALRASSGLSPLRYQRPHVAVKRNAEGPDLSFAAQSART